MTSLDIQKCSGRYDDDDDDDDGDDDDSDGGDDDDSGSKEAAVEAEEVDQVEHTALA